MGSRTTTAGILFCVSLALPMAGWSQVDTGTIRGTVTDGSGRGVPNALVSVNSVETGLSLNGATNGDGAYVFPPLRAGGYSVTVERSGVHERDPHLGHPRRAAECGGGFPVEAGRGFDDRGGVGRESLAADPGGLSGPGVHGAGDRHLAAQRPQLHPAGATHHGHHDAGGGDARADGERQLRRQRRSEYLQHVHTGRDHEQQQHGGFPERRGVRGEAAGGRHPRVQGADRATTAPSSAGRRARW